MNETNLIPLQAYAEQVGKSPRSVRQKCQLGTLPGAIKMGRDWFIPINTPYTDNRVKTGKYKNFRKKNDTP